MAIKIGLMGFGTIGRKLYSESLKYNNIEISAICDIGNPEILVYLIQREFENTKNVSFKDNFLKSNDNKSRFLNANDPGDVPWDLFDVNFVIDATGKFRTIEYINKHLNAGAKRVIISTIPGDNIDRLVVYGVNEDTIELQDRTISAGSSTMNALALLLKSLLPFGIDCINMTTIHSYTSDQSLQDVAGSDFRCSRSASQNIIPNNSDVENWISQLFPSLENKISCNALNVPVQKGSMLDLSMAFTNDKINGITNDPVVSSDIIGDPRSLVFDTQATLKAGKNLIKVLGWYDNGHCHATRILDVVQAYTKLKGFK
jgi:glyceraldehyde 3-phosphate dehydrogenase